MQYACPFSACLSQTLFILVGEWNGRDLMQIDQSYIVNPRAVIRTLDLMIYIVLDQALRVKVFSAAVFCSVDRLWSSGTDYSLGYCGCSVATDVFLRCPWQFFLVVIEDTKDDWILVIENISLPLMISREGSNSPAGLRHHTLFGSHLGFEQKVWLSPCPPRHS